MRWAMVSRDSNTFSSDIEHHLIHEFERNRNVLSEQRPPSAFRPIAGFCLRH
jgi:hypothetical protein